MDRSWAFGVDVTLILAPTPSLQHCLKSACASALIFPCLRRNSTARWLSSYSSQQVSHSSRCTSRAALSLSPSQGSWVAIYDGIRFWASWQFISFCILTRVACTDLVFCYVIERKGPKCEIENGKKDVFFSRKRYGRKRAGCVILDVAPKLPKLQSECSSIILPELSHGVWLTKSHCDPLTLEPCWLSMRTMLFGPFSDFLKRNWGHVLIIDSAEKPPFRGKNLRFWVNITGDMDPEWGFSDHPLMAMVRC